MPRRPLPTVALALALVLAACGAPPPPTPDPEPEPFVAEGVYVGDPALLPMSVAYVAYAASVLPVAVGAEVAPNATELVPGLWVVGSTFVGTDGEVALELLDADAMPADALVPAADAFQGGFGGDVPLGCTVAPDDAEARVTAFGFGGSVVTPGLVAFTPSGIGQLVFTTTAVDLSDPGLTAVTLVAFVHADRPVALTSSGTCVDADQALTVDVDLEAGWNRVALRLSDLDAPVATVVIEDDAGTALRLQPFL
jgi:hypothetical protein